MSGGGLLLALPALAPVALPAQLADRALAFTNGRWLGPSGFEPAARYVLGRDPTRDFSRVRDLRLRVKDGRVLGAP